MVTFLWWHFVARILIESDKGISRVRSKKWCQEQLFAVVRFHLQIYYWGESRLSERRRREISGDAMSVNVSGGSKRSHTVTKLTPYTNYNFSITAYNDGGEGPASDEAYATTDEAGKLCYGVHSPLFLKRVLNETDCPPLPHKNEHIEKVTVFLLSFR